jgi:hypothetical protein
MNHPVIGAALARERRKLLLADAETVGQARLARAHRRNEPLACCGSPLHAATGHNADQLHAGLPETMRLSHIVRSLLLEPLRNSRLRVQDRWLRGENAP